MTPARPIQSMSLLTSEAQVVAYIVDELFSAVYEGFESVLEEYEGLRECVVLWMGSVGLMVELEVGQ